MRRPARGLLAAAALAIAPTLGAAADPLASVPAAPLVSLSDFAGACGTVLVCAGNAAAAGGALRLVPAAREQAGAAWLATPVDLAAASGFVSTFSFHLSGAGEAMVADGLAFVIARDPSGLGDPSRYGGSMGYEGVGDSLAVEFDSFDNGEPGGANHVGVDRDGSMASLAWAAPYATAACDDLPAGCLANGDVWTAIVTYDGAAHSLSVAVRDGEAPYDEVIAGYSVDLAGMLGGGPAYLGFSAGTGDGFADHDLLEWTLHSTLSVSASPSVDAVPEPASVLLLATAIAAAGLARRPRRPPPALCGNVRA